MRSHGPFAAALLSAAPCADGLPKRVALGGRSRNLVGARARAARQGNDIRVALAAGSATNNLVGLLEKSG